MKKRLYIAYGSNLNLEQMSDRCPTAKLVGTGVVEGYELQFKGRPDGAFATIGEKENGVVPVAVWELQPLDELKLNRYEGYPTHYFKRDIPVKIGGHEVTGMVYIMNLQAQFNRPSQHYYDTVEQGYRDCHLDTDCLMTALDEAEARVQERENAFANRTWEVDNENFQEDDDEEFADDDEFDDRCLDEEEDFYDGELEDDESFYDDFDDDEDEVEDETYGCNPMYF